MNKRLFLNPVPRVIRLALCAIAWAGMASSTQAQSTQPDTRSDAAPAISFRVLYQKVISDGSRSIILNRVAPPPEPLRAAGSAAPSLPALSAEDPETLSRQESKKSELLFLFATVFDRGVTALHWSAGGREYRALSNIDFNYFTVLGQIETQDTVYGLMLAIDNEPIEAFDAERGVFLTKLSKTRSEYVLIEDKEQVATDASLTGLDALHVYFDAHRQELIADYAKREAARVEQEQWLRDHPPAPKDTVINFWPGKTTIFIDAPTKGGK